MFSVGQKGGFLSGFVAAGLGETFAEADPNPNLAVGAVENAVAGGVGSVLGGGKFGNGALTGAFGYLFNQSIHRDAEPAPTNDCAPGCADTVNFVAGRPNSLFDYEIEPGNPFAATAGFRAVYEGSPMEVRLATTIIMIQGGAYPAREVLSGDNLQLPGGRTVLYNIYSVGPPDAPGPERIAHVPGQLDFYYSPYHYKPVPVMAPNAWIKIVMRNQGG
jgi:hypothetical protein